MTLLALDTSVLIHSLENSLGDRTFTKPQLEALVAAQLAYVQSGCWMGALLPDDFKVVWLADTKVGQGYWRHEYLADPENTKGIPERKKGKKTISKAGDTVAYKAGRKLPTHRFSHIKSAAFKTIAEQGWYMFRHPGYEADDLAATLCYVNERLGSPEDIWLITVDADWMGLVSPSVTWFCSHGWYPRVRSADMLAFNYWCKKRLGKAVEKPRDIWPLKAEHGDKSDNLPPGSPIEVIDLLAPPPEHRLWDIPHIRKAAKTVITQPVSSVHLIAPEVLDRATRYMRSLAVQPVIRPFDSDRDLFHEVLDNPG